MPMISTVYCKGAGGSTTTAFGLAAVAPPAMRPVLVECDPAGGDLMLRHRLAAAPSLVDLAAASREGTLRPSTDAGGIEVFNAVEQQIRLRDRWVDVVVAPPGGAQARAALGELTRPTNPVLTAARRLVIADCGRWDPGSAARPLLGAANVVLVLVRARADELAHLREHLGDLVDLVSGRLVVLLAPGGVYPPDEVYDVLTHHLVHEAAAAPTALDVAGPLPADRRGAGVLAGDLLPGRRWRRLPLLTVLAGLLDEVTPYLTTPTNARMPGREVIR